MDLTGADVVDLFAEYERSGDEAVAQELGRRGLGNALLTFGTGAAGPVMVYRDSRSATLAGFSSGATFVVAISSRALELGVRRGITMELARKGLLRDVIFEAFEEPAATAVEIGEEIPPPMARSVLRSCVASGFWKASGEIEVYRLPDDDRFGYGRRVYVGSRKPTGRRLSRGEVAEVLGEEQEKVVFVSHRCLDDEHRIVRRLQDALAGEARVVIDELEGGDRTAMKIQADLKSATHFVLLATSPALSRWVEIESRCAEYRAAREAIVVICVKSRDVALPGFLDQFIAIPLDSVEQAAGNVRDRVRRSRPARRLSIDVARSRQLVEDGRVAERDHAEGDARGIHRAIALYDRAIEDDFCNHHAWLNKGWCSWKLHSDSVAWTQVRMAELLRPDSDRVRDVIGRMKQGFRTLR